MKKVITAIALALTSLTCLAQAEGQFTFMGIPLEGNKADMVQALKEKGFNRDVFDTITGIFNGENVELYISTNNGIVDRIRVQYPYCSETNDTRIKYNSLLSRFNRNPKYISVFKMGEVPMNEGIYTNISRNTKYYDVIYFYLKPGVSPDAWIADLSSAYLLKYAKPIEPLSYEETEEALFCLPESITDAIGGIVWFTMITNHQIEINYINLKNRPKGEDL